MILSLINPDISSPSVRQAFQNCQDMHRCIMKAFDHGREEAKVLYRILRSEKNIQIYVQSAEEPHWERISQYGFHCEKMKDISQLQESFHSGQKLLFTLLACPTKKVESEGKNSKRVTLRGQEVQLDWLKRQGEKNGFTLLEAHLSGKSEQVSGKRTTGEFHLSGIPFEGVLQIQDLDAFKNGFMNGIGSEKAYGFGMLMVNKV